ncbi:MAG: hypothetical protein HQL84_09620 [Magnetococcales bacterium]|nr:hypothetical protein [Magnetococcales bacterium]MBF0150289.1 hypothetical protein [Magnetococcales bacterium]MBF0632750.1 hypothetical protein [Magnetococcales bacterium]
MPGLRRPTEKGIPFTPWPGKLHKKGTPWKVASINMEPEWNRLRQTACPDWKFWRQIPEPTLLECILLSLDTEPREFQDWWLGTKEVSERLEIAINHIHAGKLKAAPLPFLSYLERRRLAREDFSLDPYEINRIEFYFSSEFEFIRQLKVQVDLHRFARWAVALEWEMPSEMIAVAETKPKKIISGFRDAIQKVRMNFSGNTKQSGESEITVQNVTPDIPHSHQCGDELIPTLQTPTILSTITDQGGTAHAEPSPAPDPRQPSKRDLAFARFIKHIIDHGKFNPTQPPFTGTEAVTMFNLIIETDWPNGKIEVSATRQFISRQKRLLCQTLGVTELTFSKNTQGDGHDAIKKVLKKNPFQISSLSEKTLRP